MKKSISQNNKIIFVTPPYERVAAGYEFIKHVTNRSPSLGLLYLAAAAREAGYQASIIESDIENLNPQQVAERIIRETPAFIGITLFTVGVWQAAEVARLCKERLAECKIIVGGPHISSMGMETMQRFAEFDIAVVHEGEEVLPELLKQLESNNDLTDVKGIIFRNDMEVLKTAPAPSIKELDSLPMPAWDLLPDFPDAYLPAIFDYPRGPVATMVASRGCPFLCKFCDTSTFGAQVRANSPQTVFNMMQHLQQEFGIQHIQFVDDLFLASRVRTLELCELIIENNLQISWGCTARVDTVKPDVLKRMKQAGCWEISFGLETGSNELLQKMEKAARIEVSEQAVNWTAEAGIRCKGLFMLGYPGETKDSIKKTKAFIKRLPMSTMNLSKFTPYPGSPVYRELYGTNIKDDHWQKMNGMNFVWAPEGFTVEELDAEYQRILRAFFQRMKVGHSYIFIGLKYPKHFTRLYNFLTGYIQAKLRSYLGGRRGLLMKDVQQDM